MFGKSLLESAADLLQKDGKRPAHSFRPGATPSSSSTKVLKKESDSQVVQGRDSLRNQASSLISSSKDVSLKVKIPPPKISKNSSDSFANVSFTQKSKGRNDSSPSVENVYSELVTREMKALENLLDPLSSEITICEHLLHRNHNQLRRTLFWRAFRSIHVCVSNMVTQLYMITPYEINGIISNCEQKKNEVEQFDTPIGRIYTELEFTILKVAELIARRLLLPHKGAGFAGIVSVLVASSAYYMDHLDHLRFLLYNWLSRGMVNPSLLSTRESTSLPVLSSNSLGQVSAGESSLESPSASISRSSSNSVLSVPITASDSERVALSACVSDPEMEQDLTEGSATQNSLLVNTRLGSVISHSGAFAEKIDSPPAIKVSVPSSGAVRKSYFDTESEESEEMEESTSVTFSSTSSLNNKSDAFLSSLGIISKPSKADSVTDQVNEMLGLSKPKKRKSEFSDNLSLPVKKKKKKDKLANFDFLSVLNPKKKK